MYSLIKSITFFERIQFAIFEFKMFIVTAIWVKNDSRKNLAISDCIFFARKTRSKIFAQ